MSSWNPEEIVMDFRWLECFVAVAKEGTFTRAAAKLHVAQPGVSALVRRLEQELGQPLFDRSGHTIRLTEAGATVLPLARIVLDAVSAIPAAVDELTGLLRGQVAIGVVASCGAIDLPGLLAGFHRNHAAVAITLREGNTDQLVDALQAGEIDLAFVGLAARTPQGIHLHVVADEPLVATVPRGDPLASARTVAMREIEGRPLISLPRGTGIRAGIEDFCADTGVQLRIAFEASNPLVLAQLAARGLGVAILPASVGRAWAQELHSLAITPEVRGRVALAWRANGPLSPATQALIRYARATLPAVAPTDQAGSCLTP